MIFTIHAEKSGERIHQKWGAKYKYSRVKKSDVKCELHSSMDLRLSNLSMSKHFQKRKLAWLNTKAVNEMYIRCNGEYWGQVHLKTGGD